MANHIERETAVGRLVAERPARSRVFEAVRIDYCCGGKVSLGEACRKRGIEPDVVIDLLRLSDEDAERAGEEDVDPAGMGLGELADHIEQTHHRYLREELPRLERIVEKVANVHGKSERGLITVRRAFNRLHEELMSHMMKEERILFPMIRELEAGGEGAGGCVRSIAGPIRQMESEHDDAGDALRIMNEATNGYTPPEWACNTYRAMLDGLAQLEADMHRHVHKENNVLFPRALEREAAVG